MTELGELIEQIPLRHNLVSYLVFTGVIMGLLLAGVIAFRAPRQNRSLTYLACFIACVSLVTLDTFLCYTGWMKYSLAWNDSTEPLTLLIAPLMYLSMRFLVLRKPLKIKWIFLHVAPAVLYALSQIGYYTQPLSVKYNAYKGAYFKDLPFVAVPEGTTYGYALIKNHHRWLLLVSFSVYGILTFWTWFKNRKSFGSPASGVRISKYRFSSYILILLFIVFAILLGVYINFKDDSGDHFITLLTFAIMAFTIVVFVSESRFFQQTWLLDKYETQGAADQDLDLDQLRAIVSDPDFFTAHDASLNGAAQALEIHANKVSRLVNQGTGGNFNDYLNGFRVNLACERLRSTDYKQLTIEAIGKSVGFRSKSAFYEAFKKHRGMSPSQFMKGSSTS